MRVEWGRGEDGGRLWAPTTWPPRAHKCSYPRPNPLESNRQSRTPVARVRRPTLPVKLKTALMSHKPGQTQEHHMSLYWKSEHPSRLRKSFQPLLPAPRGPRGLGSHPHLPEGGPRPRLQAALRPRHPTLHPTLPRGPAQRGSWASGCDEFPALGQKEASSVLALGGMNVVAPLGVQSGLKASIFDLLEVENRSK